MKKKLLSLVLAGAMVASTSVSAFAASKTGAESAQTTPTTPIAVPNGEITGQDNKEYTTDVTVEGSVANNTGQLPPSTFNVTIPTNAAFTVDKSGNLQATTIKVSNKGTQNIDVYANKFIDTTPAEDSNITVVAESQLTGKNKTNVSLSIGGKLKVLYLKSEPINGTDNNGIYTDIALNKKAQDDNLKLTSLAPGESEELKLQGNAGKSNESLDPSLQSNGATDRFTLTLRIKKS